MLSWKSDPYLWWVFDSWISRKGSPTKLIQHSPALQELYGSHVRALIAKSRISKMKYAKQRFSSTAVPLQRCVMFFKALWRFCIDVQATRAGTDPARYARKFLSEVTAESVVQAAMMAEAADEQLLFRRFFDHDKWDATSVALEINAFLNKLSSLFITTDPAAPAGCLRHGFVKYAIEGLATPHVCWVDGKQRIIGGPGAVTPAIIQRCLSRMANFVRLTVAAASAEFPRWQVVQALGVLNLEHRVHRQRGRPQQPPAEQKQNINRLAQAFALDPDLLEDDFLTCESAATARFVQAGNGNSTAAWIGAITQLHRGVQARLQASPLARILHIAQCWEGLSTSKVEQTFGAIKSIVTGLHRHCTSANENMEARLCSDLRGASQEFKKRVFQAAKLIWCDLIPRSRASGKDRFGNFTRGLKRKAKQCDSEQGFLRKRRAAATAATSSSSTGDIYALAVAAGAATWSKEHQTCEDKWEIKRDATKYSGEHTMLPEDDVDPEMLRVARIARAKAAASAEKARAKLKSLRRVFQKRKWTFNGMPVCLCESLCGQSRSRCQSVITKHKMKNVQICSRRYTLSPRTLLSLPAS